MFVWVDPIVHCFNFIRFFPPNLIEQIKISFKAISSHKYGHDR